MITKGMRQKSCLQLTAPIYISIHTFIAIILFGNNTYLALYYRHVHYKEVVWIR